jgi:hypothetical protein
VGSAFTVAVAGLDGGAVAGADKSVLHAWVTSINMETARRIIVFGMAFLATGAHPAVQLRDERVPQYNYGMNEEQCNCGMNVIHNSA